MRQIWKVQTLWWALYAVVLFLIYHLLVKIAFLDGSWIALVVFIPVLAIACYLIRPEERRQVIVFSIGFLLLDRSLTRLDLNSMLSILLGGLIAILVVALLAKWYGKLANGAILMLVVIAVLANVGFNRDNLSVLNHFYVKWESERLYNGTWVDYFPITLYDVNKDGQMEIVTYGNADQMKLEEEEKEKPETEAERKALAEKLLPLKAEPISLYVFSWKNGQMERMDESKIPAETLAAMKQQLPEDFPGFPYYLQADGQLQPKVQRQSYAEAMLQAGTAPYRALVLDLQNIQKLLKENQGQMDHLTDFGPTSKYRDLVIANGQISGTYDGKPFAAPTMATKLLGTMHLPGGREGLITQGEKIGIYTLEADGSLAEAYALTTKQVSLANSDFIPADIDHDGTDELLVAGSPSYILKAADAGKWQILWASQKGDESFRFSAFAPVGHDSDPEIVAMAKSWVSSYPMRYLSGFSYEPDGLKQLWRIYLPLMNIQVGDVDGDKENEIIATTYDTHRLLVLKQHDIPVLPIVIGLFAALLGYGLVRRFRHA